MFTNLHTAAKSIPMERFADIPVGTTFAFGPHRWYKFSHDHAEKLGMPEYTHAGFSPSDIVVAV